MSPDEPKPNGVISPQPTDRIALLSRKINELSLRIPGTRLEALIQQLYDELEQAGLHFRPKAYLSDEWGCPDRVPVIGIPFYLADPVLSGPIDTLRWELIREGLEDVEWLTTLEERLAKAPWWRFGARSQAARALRAARRLVPSLTDYEMDPDRLYAVRLRIGEAIERLGVPRQ